MQEDKEALFDALETMHQLLPVVTATVSNLRINAEAMASALTDDLLATDLADYLVRKGISFRQSHHIVGEVVRAAAERELELSQVPLSALKRISPHFASDVAMYLTSRFRFSGGIPTVARRLRRFARKSGGRKRDWMPNWVQCING